MKNTNMHTSTTQPPWPPFLINLLWFFENPNVFCGEWNLHGISLMTVIDTNTLSHTQCVNDFAGWGWVQLMFVEVLNEITCAFPMTCNNKYCEVCWSPEPWVCTVVTYWCVSHHVWIFNLNSFVSPSRTMCDYCAAVYLPQVLIITKCCDFMDTVVHYNDW